METFASVMKRKEVSAVGQRVEIHPGHDRWMMGDRFGEVTEVLGGGRFRVLLDKSEVTGVFEGCVLSVV